MIREHVDFEIIRKRLGEGGYKSSMNKLYRDLLLLINNARVFYQKGTSEFFLANQLNELVKKQMTITLKKPNREYSPPLKENNSCLVLVPFVVKNVAGSLKPVSSKPRMSVPMVACRKRSSLATKPLPLLSPPGSDKKTVDVEKLVSEKDDKSLISKKITAIRNVKKRDSGMNVDEVKKPDEEKKGSNKTGSLKKESAAARFLKRMRVGEEQNKSTGSNKSGVKKRAVTGKTPRNVKRNNGRATKGEAAPSSYSSPVLGKRSREAGQEKEGGSSSSTPSKKRVRR